MTNEPDSKEAARSTAPSEFRLHSEPPRVTRLSRRVLIGISAASALAIAGALGYALHHHSDETGPKELFNTENRPKTDALLGLPKDYTGLPRWIPHLGPPLPGDLGRPILNAGNPNILMPPSASDADARRRAQEAEAARVSRLFTQTEFRAPNVVKTVQAAVTDPTTPQQIPAADSTSAQNMQDRKIAFLNAPVDRRTVSSDRLTSVPSPYVVQAGTVIPAALVTGIRSDLPGEITAQVTEAVYDSPTGKYLLIPQGSRLIGQYDSSVAFGQSRVLLVWTRLIMPNGTSIVLERLPGSDASGYAGLEDEVDYHWLTLFEAAALSTMLSVGAEAGTSNGENSLVQAIRMGASNSTSQVGQNIVQRQLNIQPTLTIRPGFPVRVMVNRDLILKPYAAGSVP